MNAPKTEQLNELALFAGDGGGILGGILCGHRTVCAVERDAHGASILAQRQNDGYIPPFPIWSDVLSFRGEPWRGVVDIVSGGFPCQDISKAGKGDGLDGERSSMWYQFARIIREVRPRYAFVENSPVLTSRGLGVVLGDLAEAGYDATWDVFGADDTGAPHHRERIWILAHAHSDMPSMHAGSVGAQAQDGRRNPQVHIPSRCGSLLAGQVWDTPRNSDGRRSEPDVPRVADGVAYRLDRIRGTGNGQVPAVVLLAWTTLYQRIQNR